MVNRVGVPSPEYVTNEEDLFSYLQKVETSFVSPITHHMHSVIDIISLLYTKSKLISKATRIITSH